MTYYVLDKSNGTVILQDENLERIRRTVSLCFPGLSITEIKETLPNEAIVDYKLVDKEEAQRIEEEKKRKYLDGLCMTPLDFLNAIEEDLGIPYAVIKGLMEQYPEVEKQLKFCQNVYRGNPLIEQMAKKINENITSEQLDELFVKRVNKNES